MEKICGMEFLHIGRYTEGCAMFDSFLGVLYFFVTINNSLSTSKQ